MSSLNFDTVLVGGGLQNALIALALLRSRPGSVAVVEQQSELGGNHLWCFHAGDVPDGVEPLVEPLVVRSWPGYDVHFASSTRRLEEPYSAISSQQLHQTLVALAARDERLRLLLGETATSVAAGRVELASGTVLRAPLVIDARGPEALNAGERVGYQKFVGLELELVTGKAPELPTLMDARVEQSDGLRFFYLLPLAERRVLIEDTYFSDRPTLDRERLRAEIFAYARRQNLVVGRVVREERGVLPLPLRRVRPRTNQSGLIHAGYQGGWFHPTTGYSLPLALRLAAAIGAAPPQELEARVAALIQERDRQQRYFTFLNRLLFEAFAPEQRINVFERFYRLPAETVRRFYAMDLSAADRARILCGRPPRGFHPGPLLFPPSARPVVPARGDNA